MNSFEAKLQAVEVKLESLKQTTKESAASVEACRQLFTVKGTLGAVVRPLRTCKGVYSETVHQFVGQMHYSSPKA